MRLGLFAITGALALGQQVVMVPMRDGVKLSTAVHRPAGEGRFPVIVYRTPYNKGGLAKQAEYFVNAGYAVVAQDVRGRFASEGEFYPFVNEGLDGYDTIEWAAAQPWSNGRVGTAGESYLAWDQYFAAMYKPPHLEAMWAVVGGSNFYQDYAHPGGATNLGWPLWLLNSAMTSQQAAQNAAGRDALSAVTKNVRDWFPLHPAKRRETLAPFPQGKVYQDLYDHPNFDGYWRQRGFYIEGYHREMKDVPVYFLSGWYDYFLEGALRNFTGLARLQKSPKYLMVGPWPHGTGAAECGDAAFGDSARLDKQALQLEWFDRWLKDKPFTTIGEPKVRLFRMGGGGGERNAAGRTAVGGAWRQATAWPPADIRGTRYYARADRTLAPAAPPRSEQPLAFTYDPENPVPTIGGKLIGCARNQVCELRQIGCTDSNPLEQRADVLAFSTAALREPVEVTGTVRATLWISSDAPDTDFTAKLVDVYPNGFALLLTDGRIRTRFRNGFTAPAPMKAGERYKVTIDLGSTSNLFAAGHRIRLDISSSNYPAAEPNPNTGEPSGRWTRRVKARNTVWLDAAHPSFVELPIRSQP